MNNIATRGMAAGTPSQMLMRGLFTYPDTRPHGGRMRQHRRVSVKKTIHFTIRFVFTDFSTIFHKIRQNNGTIGHPSQNPDVLPHISNIVKIPIKISKNRTSRLFPQKTIKISQSHQTRLSFWGVISKKRILRNMARPEAVRLAVQKSKKSQIICRLHKKHSIRPVIRFHQKLYVSPEELAILLLDNPSFCS